MAAPEKRVRWEQARRADVLVIEAAARVKLEVAKAQSPKSD
jgi:hypothetical protein